MDTTKFKTNIKCDACVAKVAGTLNQVAGDSNWEVDLKDPARTLTVSGAVPAETIVSALSAVGYQAEEI